MKKKVNIHNAFFVIMYVVMLLNAGSLTAQLTQIPLPSYGLVRSEDNVIHNVHHLDLFYEKLYQLKNKNDNVVSVIHIGDSHIQADFLTEVVRKNLQREFGNAGRGLIVPGRVAGTNEPLNIRTSSPDVWTAKRLIHSTQPLPIGIGGITLHTNQPGARISIRMNDPTMDYRFNSLTIFRDKNPESFELTLLDSLSFRLEALPVKAETAPDVDKITLASLHNVITIQTTSQSPYKGNATFYGINLTNGSDGVLYHAIGVNGAKYIHYNAASQFVSQTKQLQPDLFIISLGTNESVEYPNIDRNFRNHIDRFVSALRTANPHAAVVLVSPPDFFIKKVKANPGVGIIRSQIIEYAVENGLGFWDMYKVNGGMNSATEWKMKGLLRPDGIHFTREGYAYQGSLLFDAIMTGYHNYVLNRHP